ncbi:DUF4870 domain-containing protein [Halorubrum pallidum]|uniref:DUF4870 domain-containing protein n=1 Tax=Halorubrum pallidum TaxID=1526114 RepID=A0ABD5T020_9EURY
MASTAESVGAGGTSENTTMAALTHVLALFTWLVGPLVIYVVTNDAFVKENARNAVNWQIWFSIYSIVASAFVLMTALVGIGLLIAPVLFLVLGLIDTVLIVIAAVKASDGEAWHYPLTIDLL